MAEPALKLADSSLNEVKGLAGSMAAGLLKTPLVVADPAVSAVQITDAVKAVSDQEVVLKAAHTNVTTQSDILAGLFATLKSLMTLSANDSAVQVQGDPVQLGILNVPIKSAGSPVPAMAGGPKNFSVSLGDHTGSADGHCDAKKNAKLYRAQTATSSGGPWTTAYEGSKSSFTVNGLPPGQETWFRMAVFVGGEWSDWSDVSALRIV